MEFIDFFFSSIYPTIVTWLITILLGYLSFKLWDTYKYRNLRVFLSVFTPFLVFFVLFFTFSVGYYGNVKNISNIILIDNKLCFIDNNLKTPRKGNNYNISRLYVLDQNTGEKIDRLMIGVDAKILKVSGKKVIIQSGNGSRYSKKERLSMYDFENKTLVEDHFIKKEYWQKNTEYQGHTDKFSITTSNNTINYYDSLTNFQFSIPIETKKTNHSAISNHLKYKDKLFFNMGNQLFCLDLVNKKIMWQKKF